MMKTRRIPKMMMVREFFTFAALLWGVASAAFFTYLIFMSWGTGSVVLDFNAARERFIELYILIPFILAIAVGGLAYTLWRKHEPDDVL